MGRTRISVILVIGLLAGAGVVATAQDGDEGTSDLVTEIVEPGVERIISDGAGHDLDATHPANRLDMDGIAIAPDGTVWLTTTYHGTDNDAHPGAGPFIWALGRSGTYPVPAPEPVAGIAALADGTLLVIGPDERVLRFDGERFAPDARTWWQLPDGGLLLRVDAADLTGRTLEDALGSIPDLFAAWVPGGGWTSLDELGRSDVPAGEHRCSVAPDLGREDDVAGVTCAPRGTWGGESTAFLEGTGIGQLAVAPDGSVWAVGSYDDGPGGLYSISLPSAE